MRAALLKRYTGTLAHIEEKYRAPGWRIEIPKNEQTAQRKCLFTEERLREMMGGRYYYANDTVLLFVAEFIGKSIGFL